MTVTTGSPWSPGPHTALRRTSGGVRPRLSLRTWTVKNSVGARLPGGEAEHAEHVPEAAGLVLAFDAGRDGDALRPRGRRQGGREADAGLLSGQGHVDEHAVLDGLAAAVREAQLCFIERG
jgi:hypothetical protein